MLHNVTKCYVFEANYHKIASFDKILQIMGLYPSFSVSFELCHTGRNTGYLGG